MFPYVKETLQMYTIVGGVGLIIFQQGIVSDIFAKKPYDVFMFGSIS